MSKNLQFFFITLLVSLPFWWGVNIFGKNLEDFLGLQFYQSPQVFSAQVLPPPLPNSKKEIPEIEAKATLSVKIDKIGNQKIIFEKNANEVLPIASLTKLMTALIVLENYDLYQELIVSREAIDQPEDFGQLKVGERLSVENLLYIMLIESSNDAAYTLADLISQEAFVDLMNIEAKFLELNNAHFADPAGYLPENFSTAKDLVKFTHYLLEKKPEIFEITRVSEFDLYDPEGIFHHRLINTNELLKDYPQIIGGKTGETSKARQCFLLILKSPRDNSILINIILGSEDRFGEMKKLIEYAR